MARSDVEVVFDSDGTRLARELAKLARKQDQMETGFKKVGTAGRKAGKKIEKSFLSGRLGAAALATTIGTTLVAALRAGEREADAAGARIRGLVGDMKDLVQISSDLADQRSFVDIAKGLERKFGFGESESRQFTFKLSSAGFSKEEISRLGVLKRFEDEPAGLALAALKIRKLFGPDTLGGTTESAIGALGVAAKASQVTAGGLANLALSPLAIGKELGFKPSTVLAATSLATLAAPSPEEARTQVAALFNAFLKDKDRRFEGIGLDAALTKVGTLSDDERRKFLGGRKEALLGLGLLRPIQEPIQGLRQSILAEAAAPSFIQSKAALAARDPVLASANELARAQARSRQGIESLGIAETREKTLFETGRGIALEQDRGVLFRALFKTVAGVFDAFNVSLETEARGLAFLLEPFSEGSVLAGTRSQLLQSVSESGASMNEAAANLLEASKQMRGGPAMVPPEVDQ